MRFLPSLIISVHISYYYNVTYMVSRGWLNKDKFVNRLSHFKHWVLFFLPNLIYDIIRSTRLEFRGPVFMWIHRLSLWLKGVTGEMIRQIFRTDDKITCPRKDEDYHPSLHYRILTLNSCGEAWDPTHLLLEVFIDFGGFSGQGWHLSSVKTGTTFLGWNKLQFSNHTN